MPHCCRIETYTTKVVGGEIHGQITTPLPANVVDFGKILRGLFPGFKYTERGTILGFSRKWELAFSIPCSTGSTEELDELLNLLTWTVTIEDSADESHSVALHYTIPPSLDTPDADAWERSTAGRLVNMAKSYDRASGSPKAAIELCDEHLVDWINQHVRYRQADVIIPAPPSNPMKTFDLPQFLASRLGHHLDIPVVMAESRRRTEQQKAVGSDLEDRYNNVAGKCLVPNDLRGMTAIAFDDIYSSGATMTDLVRATRAAGAQTVLALTATKTAKHTRGLTPSDWYKVTQEAAAGLTETSDA